MLVAFNNWELQTIIDNEYYIIQEIESLIPYKDIIECVLVGNEPLGEWYNGEFKVLLIDALKKVSLHVKELLPYTSISIPFNFAIFENTYPPSNSIIRKDLINIVNDSLYIIKNHSSNGFIMVNLYPYLTLVQNLDKIDLQFAIGENSMYELRDNSYIYTNLFSLMYDSIVVALSKENIDLPIEIGEIGWPSHGNKYANRENECIHLDKLKQLSFYGTPRQKGPLRLYLFEAIDEPWKEINAGLTERHWGILDFDTSPKCKNINMYYASIYPHVITTIILISCISGFLSLFILCKKKIYHKKKNIFLDKYTNYQSIEITN